MVRSEGAHRQRRVVERDRVQEDGSHRCVSNVLLDTADLNALEPNLRFNSIPEFRAELFIIRSVQMPEADIPKPRKFKSLRT